MISYKLAVELKKNGFPQEFSYGNKVFLDSETGETCIIPTLEQLIQECGDDFLELNIGKYKKCHSKKGQFWVYIRHFFFWKSIKRYLRNEFMAGSTNTSFWEWVHKGEGDSAEEAVANLYLNIKKDIKRWNKA